jgi:hypothetical protein
LHFSLVSFDWAHRTEFSDNLLGHPHASDYNGRNFAEVSSPRERRRTGWMLRGKRLLFECVQEQAGFKTCPEQF